jgi:hypothetical protein
MNPSIPDSNSQPASPASPSTGYAPDRTDFTATAPAAATGSARASAVPPPPPAAATRTPVVASTILGDFVGSLLGRIARWLSPGFVERSLSFSRDVGQYAVLVGAALTLVSAIYGAIKFNSFAVFLTGLGLVAALAVAQFAATRFLGAAVVTIGNTPSRISSPAFLECTGLLVLLFAAATLITGIIASIQVSSILPLLPALFTSALLMYFGALALHARIVNVAIGSGSAGEEATGILSFFFKSALKLVPIFFLLLAVAGDLALLASFSQSGQGFAQTVGSVLQFLPLPVSVPFNLVGSAVVMLACLVPIVGYFVFLLLHLMIDVARAVLSVPGKLDALRR